MKKIFSSVLIAAACLVNLPASADPTTLKVTYRCPTGLSNFGDYISGFGAEILGRSVTNKIYFKSFQYTPGIPVSLSKYSNSDTNYDSTTGNVICSYASSDTSESSFDLAYYVTNGKGGRIISKNKKAIKIVFLGGLR